MDEEEEEEGVKVEIHKGEEEVKTLQGKILKATDNIKEKEKNRHIEEVARSPR